MTEKQSPITQHRIKRKRVARPPSFQVVGISGPDGCGKTTLAQLIEERLDGKYVCFQVNFADKLKRELLSFLISHKPNNANVAELARAMTEKPTPEWARYLMRGWGGFQRDFNPQYWIQKWNYEVLLHVSQPEVMEGPLPMLVLCSDVRYVNEVEAIQAHGGSVLYLDDTGQPLNTLLHQLPEVRQIADLGFTINSKVKQWADVDQVIEALSL